MRCINEGKKKSGHFPEGVWEDTRFLYVEGLGPFNRFS
jgi:hypothetical protein